MRLLTFDHPQLGQRLGFLYKDHIVDMEKFGQLAGMALPSDMLQFIDMGTAWIAKVSSAIARIEPGKLAEVSHAPSAVKLLAPIPRPRKNIFGIGLNYTEHVAESARALDTANELPQKPVIFSKPPTAVTGPDTAIIHNPDLTSQLDWEVELAVIIGKKGKYVPKEKAMDYVYGYTVINDISARDCRRAGQWIVSKGQDTFAPMGPYLVTRDEISDPHNLELYLTLNGVEKQHSNTKYMLFRIDDLIHDLSTVFTLEPGDIIATGTPAGVGAGRTPQEWMWDGDVVEATVEGIGTLRNTVKALVLSQVEEQ